MGCTQQPESTGGSDIRQAAATAHAQSARSVPDHATDGAPGALWLVCDAAAAWPRWRADVVCGGWRQLLFLFNNVREGNQRRYLQWFAAKHLSGRESDHLLPDVARFIVSAFHPKADLIRSTAVPRWVIISWLLTVCKDKAKAVRVQHAVFTDWLPPRGGGVMDFEPGMLLIVRVRWCMVPCLCAMC